MIARSFAQRLRWAVAALLALSLHAGAAVLALVGAAPPDESVEDVGAPLAIEFAEAPAAPEEAEPEAASAAETAEAAPTPEVDQKLSAKTEADLPTAAASPTETTPDLQAVQEQTRDKQEEAERGQTTEAQEARPEPAPSAAAQRAAAASQMTPVAAEAITAPAEGSVAEAVAAPESWQRAVLAHLGRHKRYPADARSRRLEGEVVVSFRVDHGGKVADASVLEGSGHAALDREAIEMLRRAEPLPALPARVAASSATLLVPIRYRLK